MKRGPQWEDIQCKECNGIVLEEAKEEKERTINTLNLLFISIRNISKDISMVNASLSRNSLLTMKDFSIANRKIATARVLLRQQYRFKKAAEIRLSNITSLIEDLENGNAREESKCAC